MPPSEPFGPVNSYMVHKCSPLALFRSGESLGVITCSVGVASYRLGEAIGDLIDRADKALYRAKQNGRNRVTAEEPIAP